MKGTHNFAVRERGEIVPSTHFETAAQVMGENKIVVLLPTDLLLTPPQAGGKSLVKSQKRVTKRAGLTTRHSRADHVHRVRPLWSVGNTGLMSP